MQSLTYLPHFVSQVVIVGLMFQFVNFEGLVTRIIADMTGEAPVILADPRAFRPMYVISGIWQNLGWGSILYLAAMTGDQPGAVRVRRHRRGRTLPEDLARDAALHPADDPGAADPEHPDADRRRLREERC